MQGVAIKKLGCGFLQSYYLLGNQRAMQKAEHS
jgi:hypothetical protein